MDLNDMGNFIGERVVLVDEQDREIGSMEKMQAHRAGMLHRAFSIFLFDPQGRTLLQQRAHGKYHTPGLWSNACCSHVRPGEAVQAAAHRRLREELGADCELDKRFVFTYKAEVGNGLVEHEVDHVLFGTSAGPFRPSPDEVADLRWAEPDALERELQERPEDFTPWLRIIWPAVRHLLKVPQP
jgi:isopentenyl-diphosphate delta-isomerase